ncbi:tumor necrosis factor ligand superfamily member 14-like [Cynoglossus semilaevis]|uniref:tumor necrosis factor ligand superfamily member 14-like n=1 Tax=Cynoglossus semilaevis TaxID=244447 RepID=UPI000496BC84|nr:tumor necrosis factor ligand superfamily member 14-like [Cynoglossus semilaevis]XP_016890864.1 tumor necrosis factor ligand superfamily member 14-like [Cynoglossus semilaevis]
MAEGDVGFSPQVFVVNSQSKCAYMPRKNKPIWARVGQKVLLLLVAVTMFGLVVQGFFIYFLYRKTEGGHFLGQIGNKEFNEIPIPQKMTPRPFAHVIGPNIPSVENNVVQWIHDKGDAIMNQMSYDQGRLLVEKEGYYFLYSKVQLNAAMECSPILHKVVRNTSAYDESIELMRAKSFHCRTPKPTSRATVMEDIWNSFLAGIFHLHSGDRIFVTLENIQTIRPGQADNFMGAFMLTP